MLKFRNIVLERIAKGSPLKDTLDCLCREVERFLDSGSCTVVAVDTAGMIRPLSAPGFPEPYVRALDGILVGPNVGSCGSAIYHNRFVSVDDIDTDPRWAMFKSLALPLGYHACSSLPLRDETGKAVGALAVYFRAPRAPSETEQAILAVCVELCELALARHRRVLDNERRATIDSLTGLPNRAAFDEALSQLRCELPGEWALLVVDVDNLKVTNDTFGHDAGDTLIRAVGRRIANALAPEPIFRTGGDEFTVILQQQELLHDLYQTAERIFDAVAPPIHSDGGTFLPRITVGGAVLAPQDVTPETVQRNADFALYHAKETLRGGFVRYWPGIGTRMAHRHDAVKAVTEALDDDRIDARYQPILKLDTHEIVGFEALCCMRTTSGRSLPASLFKEAFADARVGTELTRRMLSIAASDIRRWLDAGLPLQHVGVNITSADFYLGSLQSRIEAAFAEKQVPLKHLIVEVTEDAYIGQRDNVVASGIRDLRLRGIRVALDDFGTGFAALAHLMSVPTDIIKIDQSFVRKLSAGHPSMAIVKGVVQIARDLGIRLVAEGIETLAQAQALSAMGCAMGQGFAFSRPVDRAAATRLLMTHGQYVPGAVPLPPSRDDAGDAVSGAGALRRALTG